MAHPYNIKLLHGFTPLGRHLDTDEQNRSLLLPFEASTIHEIHYEVANSSSVSDSNNRSHRTQSKESPFDVCSSPILGKRIHLAPHIRETRQFR